MLKKEKLLQFNLVKDCFEKATYKDRFELMSNIFKIEGINNFLLDLPSFPETSDKIYIEEMIRAVGGTQRIEGSILTDEEIEEAFKKDEKRSVLQLAEQEAVNSKKTYEFIIDYVNNNTNEPITEALIRQIHKLTTKDINYLSNKPGEYRTTSTTFGVPRRNAILQNESEIKEAMQKYIIWINSNESDEIGGHPLVKANLAHYYLTEIHPFSDGNGRVARALEAMILYNNASFNYYCFWLLANYFSTHKEKYLDNLGEVYVSLNVLPFLKFAVKGYLLELERIKLRALNKVKKLMFNDYVQYLLRTKNEQNIKINERVVLFIEILGKLGKIKMRKIYAHPAIKGIYAKKSPATLHRDLKKMVQLNLLNIKDDDEKKLTIECNYEILNGLRYN